ncbi:MAG: T9SS type A sorting domain-containing protein, partial [Hymenobacter sp.]
FQAVGRVAGAGTSSHTHSYQFTDASLARYTGGQVYYRLRQVDEDGASTYSAVRPVQVPAEAGLLVQAYPNPSVVATPVTLTIRVDHAGPVALYLTDLLGRAISQQQTDLPTGLSALSLGEANQLASGLYLLWVQQGRQQQVLTLLRQ